MSEATLVKVEECLWAYDEWHDGWETGCGEAFCITDGKPTDNLMRFCPYCGRVLREAAPQSQEEAGDELD